MCYNQKLKISKKIRKTTSLNFTSLAVLYFGVVNSVCTSVHEREVDGVEVGHAEYDVDGGHEELLFARGGRLHVPERAVHAPAHEHLLALRQRDALIRVRVLDQQRAGHLRPPNELLHALYSDSVRV